MHVAHVQYGFLLFRVAVPFCPCMLKYLQMVRREESAYPACFLKQRSHGQMALADAFVQICIKLDTQMAILSR